MGLLPRDSRCWRLAERTVREIEARWRLCAVAASSLLDPVAGLDHRRALTKGQVALGQGCREEEAAAL